MTFIYGRGEKIAQFENATEAMLCLPAMSRVLGMTLVLKTGDFATERAVLPKGCSIEKGITSVSLIYRR
jgi:hypothetical protein